MPASLIATLSVARARAAVADAAPLSSNLVRAISFHSRCARAPPFTSQKVARWFVFGVRANAFSSASAALVSTESNAGGAGGRSSDACASTQGCHVPAIGAIGFWPFHLPAPSGTVPLHFASD